MNFRILKKDLKRKKSINIILLIFIALATTFIVSSINNMTIILNATDDFLELAGVSDHLLITTSGTREENEHDKKIREFLENQKNVESFYVDDIMWLGDANIKWEGRDDIPISTGCIISKFNVKQQKFFDKDNNEITNIEDGTIYISRNVMESQNIKINDVVCLKDEYGYSKKFTVVGYHKDAFLGSALMGQERFIISENDYNDLEKNASIPYSYGKIYSVWVDDLEAYEEACFEADLKTLFFCNQDTVKATYIIDIVVAAIILLVSICLIVVSILMLRFTISFTISEDYKEIGILKAIGLRNSSIRTIYTFKYIIISIAGTLIGAIASIPFGKLMIKKAMAGMVISLSNNIIVNIVLSILVAIIVIFFAYLSTRRIKKMTPMDAIRNGNTGERFGKKSLLKLYGTKRNTNMFMALNDILCDFKKYIILFATSIIGIWLVIMPVNTTNTLGSEKVVPWFGMLRSDLYLNNSDKMIELIGAGNKDVYMDYLEEIEDALESEGIEVDRVFSEAFFRLNIRYGEVSYTSMALQGINTSAKEYEYLEGTAPVKDNEVAITHVIADIIDAKIGDTVYITVADEEVPFVVTAIYQSMNNMGEGIRFTQDCQLDYSKIAGALCVQVDLSNSSDEKLEETIKKAEEVLDNTQVYDAKGFLDSMLGGTIELIDDVKYVVLAVVMMINILVVVLMQRIFITKEKGQIAMLKAIGFNKRAIYSWQLRRIGVVLVAGVLIGTLTSEIFTKLTSGLVFKFMGCKTIEFNVEPLEVYVLYPVALVIVTLIVCSFSLRRIRKVNVQEVNDME